MASQAKNPNNTVTSSDVTNPDNGWSDGGTACAQGTKAGSTATYNFTGAGAFDLPDAASITGIAVTVKWGVSDADDSLTVELQDAEAAWQSKSIGNRQAANCAATAEDTVGSDGDLWNGVFNRAHVESTSFQMRWTNVASGKAADTFVDAVLITVYYELASEELKAEFIARQEASRDLTAKFAAINSAAEDLPAKFIARYSSFKELSAEFIARRSASEEFPCKLFCRNAGISDLLAKIVVRYSSSTECLAKLIVRWSSYKELKAEFTARQAESADYFSKLVVRHSDSIELFSKFVIRHSATVELFSIFTSRQSTAVDLPAMLVVEHLDTVNLLCRFTPKHFYIRYVICNPDRVQRSGVNTTELRCDWHDEEDLLVDDYDCKFYLRGPPPDQDIYGPYTGIRTKEGSKEFHATYDWDPLAGTGLGLYDLKAEVRKHV